MKTNGMQLNSTMNFSCRCKDKMATINTAHRNLITFMEQKLIISAPHSFKSLVRSPNWTQRVGWEVWLHTVSLFHCLCFHMWTRKKMNKHSSHAHCQPCFVSHNKCLWNLFSNILQELKVGGNFLHPCYCWWSCHQRELLSLCQKVLIKH